MIDVDAPAEPADGDGGSSELSEREKWVLRGIGVAGLAVLLIAILIAWS